MRAIAAIAAAVTTKNARQPKRSAKSLANGLDSRIPTSRPLMTSPMTRPRIACGAIEAAIGTSTCATEEAAPSTNKSARKPNAFEIRGAVAPAATATKGSKTSILRREVE